MPPIRPPSDDKMLTLKKELNFLLWTNNPRPIQAALANRSACADASQCAGINMQCAAHAEITGALFYQRGFRVVGRSGAAFVFEPAPGPSSTEGHINQILEHYWITVDNQLVDLSLYAESENPLIFRNRSVGGRWAVNFKDSTSDWETHLAAFQSTRVRRVFYISGGKITWSDSALSSITARDFPAAREHGVALTYSAIIEHCERLLSNSTASLTSMTQTDAWRALACPSGNVGTALGVP